MSKEEKYKALLPQVRALCEGEEDMIAKMANVSALLHQEFGFWWTGFYRVKRSEVGGLRSEVGGKRSEVGGKRSEVGGLRSEVGGLRSEVGGKRSEVGGLRSEVGGKRSDASETDATSDLLPHTSYLRPLTSYLVLGPFQGPLACVRIGYGKGVCGTAWKERRTVVVPDVEEFPGHIACSSESRSEIVVPMFEKAEAGGQRSEVIAVLDIDSRQLATFDDTDAHYLEAITRIMQ